MVVLESQLPADPAPGLGDLDRELTVLELALYERLDGIAERALVLHAQAAAAGESLAAARAQLIASDAWSRAGELTRALELQRRVAAGADDPLVIARARCYMASTFVRAGLVTESQEAAGDGVSLLRDGSPAHWPAEHHMVVAVFASNERHAGVDFELWEDCLRRARALGDPRMLLAVLNNFAWSAHRDPAQASRVRSLADEMTALLHADAIVASGAALDTLAAIRLQSGDLAEAERLLLRGLRDRHHVEPGSQSALLLHLAAVRRGQGRPAEAAALLERGRALALTTTTSELSVDALRDLAELDAQRGDHRRAYRRLCRLLVEQVGLQRAETDRRAAILQSIHATEAERSERRYWQELASRDALTGLYNRRRLEDELPGLLTGGEVALAMVDLDHFKAINDEHSHELGDAILHDVAQLLAEHASAMSATGFAVRLGGEEFVIVAPGVTIAAARASLEDLRGRVARRRFSGLAAGDVTFSVGLAGARPDDSRSSLMRRADARLYEAKRSGRNRVVAEL